MPRALPPANVRQLRARKGAYAQQSRHDTRLTTAKAQAASPGQQPYWEAQIDPDRKLDPTERARRAEAARREYLTGLALKSVQARRAKRNAS